MDNTDLCVTQIAKYAAVYNTRYIYTIYLLDTRYIYTIYHTLDIYLRYLLDNVHDVAPAGPVVAAPVLGVARPHVLGHVAGVERVEVLHYPCLSR